MQDCNFKEIFIETLQEEALALANYKGDLKDLDSIISCILKLQGKLVVMGVGKSGLIARKLSATFSSTGTPSFFLHPTEAMHGDLGSLGQNDCVLAISYSGESQELIDILPHIRRLGIVIITMSKSKDSRMSVLGDYFLPLLIHKEACPLQTAPTTSTTLTLAMGDALAVCLMRAREFNRNDFAMLHPGGSLGRRLFLRVSDVMQTENIPKLHTTVSLREAIVVMTQGRLGYVIFVDGEDRLLGILSDGDLRRAMFDKNFSLESQAFFYATKQPQAVADSSMLAFDVFQIMKNLKIQLIPIIQEDNILIGVIHLHALIQAGFTN